MDLKKNKKNKRTVTKEQYKILKKSIKKYGEIDPIYINKDNVLISGHQRYKVFRNEKISNFDVRVTEETDLKKYNRLNKKPKYKVNKKKAYLDFEMEEVENNLVVENELEEEKEQKKTEKIEIKKKSKTSAKKLLGEMTITLDQYDEFFDKLIDQRFWDKFYKFYEKKKGSQTT